MSLRSIQPRNLRFQLDGVPRYWLGNARARSILLDNLSILFPAGEQFFVNSVRHYEGRVRSTALHDDVRAFIQQEALHSREHARMNQWLTEQGFPIAELDARVRKLLGRVARLPARWQLGVTCALEHFTALLAQMILGDAYGLEDAHPTMRALWRWHAVEENEHASVAFDVYQHVGGWYAERSVIMLFTTLIFAAKVLQQQVRMMQSDGTATDLAEWRSLFGFLFEQPGFVRKLVKPWAAYFRPDFHPSQESAAMVANWRKEFADSPVYAASLAS